MPLTWNTSGEAVTGTLYVVSTPIGNLEDMTLRALRVLKEVDFIAAETVAHSRRICRHYSIDTRLISYNQHNRRVKDPQIIRKLNSGQHVALITNAGTPGVSDPGVSLIRQALEEGIRVSPIPGPSAVTAALSVSGMPAEDFLFLGFLSNRSGRRRKELQELTSERRTMVFFEAPHRIQDMLPDLKDCLGDRHVVVIREQTKLHEEVIAGSVSSILEELKDREVKGEFTLVVAGREKGGGSPSIDGKTRKRLEKLLREDKWSVKDIAERLSIEQGIAYRRIYRECLSIKKALQADQ